MRGAGVTKSDSPGKMRLTINAYRIRRRLRPLVSVVDAPFLACSTIDGLKLPFDDFSLTSARQFDDGIEYRRLNERRPLSTLPGNLRIVGSGALLPYAVSGFDIGYAVSVDGGLFRDHVVMRPAPREVLVVIRAADLVPSREGDEARAVLPRGAFDGPTFGLTDGGLAARQFHQAGFRMEAEKEQRQDQDNRGDAEKGLHVGCVTKAG